MIVVVYPYGKRCVRWPRKRWFILVLEDINTDETAGKDVRRINLGNKEEVGEFVQQTV
jgi:hypothetical protein